jgi:hypothetical protein
MGEPMWRFDETQARNHLIARLAQRLVRLKREHEETEQAIYELAREGSESA